MQKEVGMKEEGGKRTVSRSRPGRNTMTLQPRGSLLSSTLMMPDSSTPRTAEGTKSVKISGFSARTLHIAHRTRYRVDSWQCDRIQMFGRIETFKFIG